MVPLWARMEAFAKPFLGAVSCPIGCFVPMQLCCHCFRTEGQAAFARRGVISCWSFFSRIVLMIIHRTLFLHPNYGIGLPDLLKIPHWKFCLINCIGCFSKNVLKGTGHLAGHGTARHPA